MDFHLFKFFRGKPAGLGDDVLRNRQLAYVMQQGSGAKRLQVLSRETQPLSDFNGVNANAAKMIMRGLVLGFDGQSQGFNGTQVQARHFFHMALLVFQFAQIEPVGAVDHEHCGQSQQRGLPAHHAVHPAHESGDGGTHQVIRE